MIPFSISRRWDIFWQLSLDGLGIYIHGYTLSYLQIVAWFNDMMIHSKLCYKKHECSTGQKEQKGSHITDAFHYNDETRISMLSQMLRVHNINRPCYLYHNTMSCGRVLKMAALKQNVRQKSDYFHFRFPYAWNLLGDYMNHIFPAE